MSKSKICLGSLPYGNLQKRDDFLVIVVWNVTIFISYYVETVALRILFIALSRNPNAVNLFHGTRTCWEDYRSGSCLHVGLPLSCLPLSLYPLVISISYRYWRFRLSSQRVFEPGVNPLWTSNGLYLACFGFSWSSCFIWCVDVPIFLISMKFLYFLKK